jgi:23S rRNA pseudouridine2605 synthase
MNREEAGMSVSEQADAPVNEEVRLQKALAAAGVASRRACEELIVKGQVKVNGKLVTELGSRVNPAVDKVTVRGVPVQFDTTRVYLMLNKPAGIISTMADEEGRPDLSAFVTDYDRVFNVGRLDAETTGLLLLTNDGELANALSHPSFGVEKTYIARVVGEVTPMTIHKLMSGFELEDGFIKADRARVIDISKGHSLVEIVLHSGRNRIVRRMLDNVGHPVVGLVRKQFGPIHLGTLKQGHIRQLNKMEIGALLKAATGKTTRPPRPSKKRN